MKDIQETIEGGSETLQQIDINKPLQKVAIGNFARKEKFLGKSIVISFNSPAIQISQFGKHQISFNLDNQDWLMDISQSNLNQIIDLCGNTPKEWENKRVKVSGKSKTFSIDGNQVDGIELRFEKP